MIRLNNEKTEDFLINYGKAVQEKRASQRAESLKQEVAGISF